MTFHHQTNEELLEQYSSGNLRAFDEFFKRNKHIVFAFILSRNGNHTESEDLFQETFYRLHRYIHKFDKEKNALNWVLTIAKNLVISNFRGQRHIQACEPELQRSDELKIEAREELQKIFATLNEEEQTLLVEKFVYQENYENISKKIHATPIYARQKISRLLKRLKKQTAI